MPGVPPTIADFLTDGALAALCDGLSQITGAGVTLHDTSGRRILPAPGQPPWRVLERDAQSDLIEQLLSIYALPTDPEADIMGPMSHPPPPTDVVVEPLTALGSVIGAIAITPGGDTRRGPPMVRLRHIIAELASTVSELCDQDLRFRQSNAELNAMLRLSSLLVEARDVESVLQVALRSAVELADAQAGSVHLLDETEENLRLRASVGLSPSLSERIDSFPVQRAIDHVGLRGGVRELRDLTDLQRAELQAEVDGEGIADLVLCSLVFKHRPLGVMRLYFQSPTALPPSDRSLLQAIVEQAAAAVASARLIEVDRRHRQVQRQVEMAADVQQRMLPHSIPIVPGLDLAARYLSSFDLGGDFYDFIDLNGHVGVLIGDVSGKGLPAALIMASARSSIRAYAQGVYDIDEVLRRVNLALTRDTLPHEYVTIFLGVIDPKPGPDGGRRLTFCNAGHEPGLLFRSRSGSPGTPPKLIELSEGGTVAGIDTEAAFERGIEHLYPGDTLVLYTDGLVDAMNFQNQRFGRRRLYDSLLNLLAEEPAATARSITDHLTWEVRRFVGLREENDDTTIVAIRVH